MTPEIYKSAIENIGPDGMPLTQLHAAIREAGSTWSVDQLHLMIDCMEGVEVTGAEGNWTVSAGERSPEEELAAAIEQVVRSQGGQPLPAAKVLELLPDRFTTSEAQVRKVAKESSRLKVMGPGLIALSSNN